MMARALLISTCDALAMLLLPVYGVGRCLRIAASRAARQPAVSAWTGSPIICMAKNCRAERLLGFRSFSVVRNTYYVTDEFDYDMSKIARGNVALILCLSYAALALILIFADQVHAYADGGILPSRKGHQFNPIELRLYRLLRIRLFIWTYGADVRTRQATLRLGEPNCCTDCTQIGVACICDDVMGAKNYAKVRQAASAVFSMGDMTEYTPGSRNDLFFWPVDIDADAGKRYRPVYPERAREGPVRVVHAANHSQFKGSRYLEEAVSALRKEGVPIELVQVSRMSNDAALAVYQSADIIFDQCMIGFHGYFAIEAMALGKPVMCFIRKQNEYLHRPEECPIINTSLGSLSDDLRDLVVHREKLGDIGRRGRSYVEKFYSLEAFATRLKEAYTELGVWR